MSRIGIIIVGGDPPPPEIHRVLAPDPHMIIAADSGFDHAIALGLGVDVLVGDLDSISPGGLRLAESMSGLTIERHRPDKDFTDTELAVSIALDRGVSHLVGIAGGGDRLDHQLGTLAAFAAAARSGVRVELWWRSDHVELLHGPVDWPLADLVPGATVSLIPFGGAVCGVTTHGLRYPLTAATLAADSALGVSNIITDDSASVEIASGTLLVIAPGAL